MLKQTIIDNWSLALFQIGKQDKLLEIFISEANEVVALFSQEAKYVKLLTNKKIDKNERKKMLDKSIGDNLNRKLLNTLKLLIDYEIFIYTLAIFKKLINLINIHNKVEICDVFSPYPLSADQIKIIEKKLTKKYDKTIILKNKIDKNLIGGLKIIINNEVYDYSIKGKLEKIKNVTIKNTGGNV